MNVKKTQVRITEPKDILNFLTSCNIMTRYETKMKTKMEQQRQQQGDETFIIHNLSYFNDAMLFNMIFVCWCSVPLLPLLMGQTILSVCIMMIHSPTHTLISIIIIHARFN